MKTKTTLNWSFVARVVNVASTLGCLPNLKIEELKKRLIADNLTVEELEQIVADYIKFVDTIIIEIYCMLHFLH